MFISITFTETSIDETNKTQQKVRGSKFMFKIQNVRPLRPPPLHPLGYGPAHLPKQSHLDMATKTLKDILFSKLG